MRIAINAHLLAGSTVRAGGAFARALVLQLVARYPGHEWLMVYHRHDKTIPFALPNIATAEAGRTPASYLGYRWWYEVILPRVLRRWNAEVYLDLDGACSLRTDIPQVMLVHQLESTGQPEWMARGRQRFLKGQWTAMARKASRILVTSPWLQQEIQQLNLSLRAAPVVTSPWAEPEFVPASWDPRQATQDSYANGRPYFMFAGTMHPSTQWLDLLKAFSRFKQWQKSHMKLVMVATEPGDFSDFTGKLPLYKFRDDVIWLGHQEAKVRASLMAAAYAFVYPCLYDGFALPVLEAMQCGAPIITHRQSSMPDIAGEGAYYADPTDHVAFADAMLRLYKDETLRLRLATEALRRAGGYTAATATETVMQVLEESAGGK